MELSAGLDDRRKAIAAYWADGPNTETPPGHWNLLAQWVSRRDGHGLDEDVRMFFVLGNALLDASIAVWDAKRFYDWLRGLRQLVGDATVVAMSVVAYAETRAALARLCREGLLTASKFTAATREFDEQWPNI